MFEQSTELPEPMAYHCSAQINKTHLIIAGNIYPPHTQAYVVDTNSAPFKFTKLPVMLKQRWGCACAVIRTNNKFSEYSSEEDILLLVAGGEFPNYVSTEFYSFLNNNWKDGPLLPRGFYYGGYTQNIDDFILMGGWDGSSYRSDLLRYNQADQKFEFLEGNLITGRGRFGAINVDREDFCT